jgi:hypothetical protein
MIWLESRASSWIGGISAAGADVLFEVPVFEEVGALEAVKAGS